MRMPFLVSLEECESDSFVTGLKRACNIGVMRLDRLVAKPRGTEPLERTRIQPRSIQMLGALIVRVSMVDD